MVTQLRAGNIDGYCVGEPWSSVAVAEGLGRVLISSHEIWNNSPEKVFGVNLEWAEQYPNTHRALLGALLEAARWSDALENRPAVAELIAQSRYVNAPASIVRQSMTGTFRYAQDEPPVAMPDFNCFFRFGASFPWRSHALWFLTQMVRWGQLDRALDLKSVAAQIYRPDLYRDCALALGLAVPSIDEKPEGLHPRGWTLTDASVPLPMGPDLFFDGRPFDPADPVGYIAGFEVHCRACGIDELAAVNRGPGVRAGAIARAEGLAPAERNR
jgi:nitrate/nitrite transport system substrate-binding protein